MQFIKMHGAGNDYVYVDCFRERVPTDVAGLAIAVSDRHMGIGGDGLVLIMPSERAPVRMRMFNADGSEAEMCGNALRCVAKYAAEEGLAQGDEFPIETGTGVLTVSIAGRSGPRVDRVRVNMGAPILVSHDIPTTLPGDPPRNVALEVGGETFEVTCVSMGNPHCVIFVDEITDRLVLNVGPQIEHHPAFPNRVNVEFIRVISPAEFEMRVWERGSGETLACGTGACAVAVAGVLTGRLDRCVQAHLRGGDLELEWTEQGDVFMTGPATEVFRGEWPHTSN
ncbi:MAG: diaminopimelate epimerase [Planctomycetaceae bacterium]|nr:diaminopimelate epimerase [Planctomycetaceae bacterium]